MSVTALDLITSAYRICGVVGQGQPVSGNLQQDAFTRLNRMLSSWAAQRLTIFQTTEFVYVLTATGTYTIGPGATFNQARPLWIAGAKVRATDVTPNLDIDLQILDDDEWADIPLKTLTSALPRKLYYDTTLDTATGRSTIKLHPVPNGQRAISLALYVPTALSSFADLAATSYIFPDGYEEGIQYQLAKRLGPEHGGGLSPEQLEVARDSFAFIKRSNNRPGLLKCDSAVLAGSRGGRFNWRTGGVGRRG